MAAEKLRLRQTVYNEYVQEFLDSHKEYNYTIHDCYEGNYYDEDCTLRAPQVQTMDGDYYITGNQMGQTRLAIRVPGLAAVGYVNVRVMADSSSKANPMVALGQDHTLALKSDGTVWSWGSNDRGQLGREDYSSMGQVIFPHMIEQLLKQEYDNGTVRGSNYFEAFGIKNNDNQPISSYEDWYNNSSRNADFVNDVKSTFNY